ncbi:MAG: pseudouridine-5'-phosphate glycosidase [Gemmatimonadota bacterium]|nr:MAG: pseudouridine-5'-phosphate glycosidase [Gemmatimonadota bacterium]
MDAPAVALETGFLTRGLPGAVRLEAAQRMAEAVRSRGVEPAFIGVFRGQAIVGLALYELELLAQHEEKLSTRDLPAALARHGYGGTTVAATMFLAHLAGLTVAATGGIGGVHRPLDSGDVSADLYELARTPSILVCSGVKAIADLRATLERLETLGVTVVGYGTDQLPAFWSPDSGLALDTVAESAEGVAEIWRRARALNTLGATLVCVPPPREVALTTEESEQALAQALEESRVARVTGPDVTPYLLSRIAELTEGRSLRANLGLLENNAGVAAAIRRVLDRPQS